MSVEDSSVSDDNYGVSENYEVIARNIRRMRSLENLTQEELAAQAGISPVTLYQAERGKPVRPKTLAKIAKALNHNLSELRSDRGRILTADADFVVHRHQQLTWFISTDSRKTVPPNAAVEIQEESERQRLGYMGLVPMFYATATFVMARGPGLVQLELYRDYSGYNSMIYQNVIVSCTRGEAKVVVNGESTLLFTGDAIGFNNSETVVIGPQERVTSGLAPRVLWIGANRIGKVPEG